MPYVTCSACQTTTYSAARFSTCDDCPRCGRPLQDARGGADDDGRRYAAAAPAATSLFSGTNFAAVNVAP